MKLYLDTTNNLETVIRLDEHEYRQSYASPRDQNLWHSITTALTDQDLQLTKLSEIEVNLGPGSFTGIRVGISVAQALAYALQIPVNGQTALTPLEPQYGKPPGITL